MKKFRWQFILAGVLIIVGLGGQLAYDFYLKPYVLAKPVVKIKVNGEFREKNYILTEQDVYLDKAPIEHLPAGYLSDVSDAINKIINVNLTDGTILTSHLVDVDDLQPGEDEGIFSLPKESIYAINGSLRVRDQVNVYIVDSDQKDQQPNDGNLSELLDQTDRFFLENVMVVHVRTDDNQDVKDTETGNIANRQSSTGRVSVPELKLTMEQGLELLTHLERGKLLWIVRVE